MLPDVKFVSPPPIETFPPPVVTLYKDLLPIAVLLLPEVRAARASIPNAVFWSPEVLFPKALVPIPICWPDTPSELDPKVVPAAILLIVASTSLIEPNVKVPSISALFSMVTVPEVCPSERVPEEKSPVIRFCVAVLPI